MGNVLPFQAAVEGFCDPGFEPLRDAFRLNFAERGELGAAVCVMVGNNVVADLYGGWADREQGRRWQPWDNTFEPRSPARSAPTCTSACPPPSTTASPRSSGQARLPQSENRPAWTTPS
jgi:hypothetical protein